MNLLFILFGNENVKCINAISIGSWRSTPLIQTGIEKVSGALSAGSTGSVSAGRQQAGIDKPPFR